MDFFCCKIFNFFCYMHPNCRFLPQKWLKNIYKAGKKWQNKYCGLLVHHGGETNLDFFIIFGGVEMEDP